MWVCELEDLVVELVVGGCLLLGLSVVVWWGINIWYDDCGGWLFFL